LKIVILCAYFQPELGYREYYYARNLAKLGHEVNVITSDRIVFFPGWENIAKSAGYDISRYRGFGRSQIDGFYINRIPTLFEYDRLIILKGMKKLLTSIKPDIIHIIENGFLYSFPAAFYKKSLGYKLIYEIEISFASGHLLSKREYYEYYLAKKRIIKYMIKKSDRLNICTEQVYDFIYEQIKESREKLNRMSLGVDPDIFYANDEERMSIRNMLNVTDDEILIMTSGKIELQKNYDALIKSISSIKSNYKIRFLIIGSGSESAIKSISESAKKEGIQDKIIMQPFLKKTELRKFYNASDIGVWTQATITILEAIGCGLPIIVPNDKATAHLVDNGNGLLYDVNSSQLSDCLGYYMSSENRREAKIKALDAFENKYSYLTLTKQLVNDVYMPSLAKP
jgi:glycosyltransferase involved in cell wall biosynthesis